MKIINGKANGKLRCPSAKRLRINKVKFFHNVYKIKGNEKDNEEAHFIDCNNLNINLHSISDHKAVINCNTVKLYIGFHILSHLPKIKCKNKQQEFMLAANNTYHPSINHDPGSVNNKCACKRIINILP